METGRRRVIERNNIPGVYFTSRHKSTKKSIDRGRAAVRNGTNANANKIERIYKKKIQTYSTTVFHLYYTNYTYARL